MSADRQLFDLLMGQDQSNLPKSFGRFGHAQMQQRLRQMQQAEAENDDARAIWALERVGEGFAGKGNGKKWLNDNAYLKPFASQIANSQLMASWMGASFGGSNVAMMQGIAQGVGMSGFQLGNNQLYGYGGGTAHVTGMLMDAMKKEFFQANGLARLNKTSGFNRTELGEMIGVMGAQGSLGDLKFGDLNDTGGKSVEINETSKRNFTKKVQDTAKALRSLKDIVGDKSVTELMNIGQDLTGVQVGTAGGAGLLRSRLTAISSVAQANGLTETAAIDMVTRINQMLSKHNGDFGGISARSATQGAGIFQESAERFQMMRRNAAKYGRSVNFSAEDVAGDMMRLVDARQKSGYDRAVVFQQRLKESGMLGDLSKEEREKLAYIAEHGEKTQDEVAFMSRIGAKLGQSHSLETEEGQAAMMQQLSKTGQEEVARVQGRTLARAAQASALNKMADMSASNQTYTDPDQRVAILTELDGSGNMLALRKAMAEKFHAAGGDPTKEEITAADVDQLVKDSKITEQAAEVVKREIAAGRGKGLRQLLNSATGDDSFQAFTKAEVGGNLSRRASFNMIDAMSGYMPDLKDSVLQGLFGNESITDSDIQKQMVALQLKEAGKNGAPVIKDKDGNVQAAALNNLDKDQLRSVLKAFGKDDAYVGGMLQDESMFKDGKLTEKGYDTLKTDPSIGHNVIKTLTDHDGLKKKSAEFMDKKDAGSMEELGKLLGRKLSEEEKKNLMSTGTDSETAKARLEAQTKIRDEVARKVEADPDNHEYSLAQDAFVEDKKTAGKAASIKSRTALKILAGGTYDEGFEKMAGAAETSEKDFSEAAHKLATSASKDSFMKTILSGESLSGMDAYQKNMNQVDRERMRDVANATYEDIMKDVKEHDGKLAGEKDGSRYSAEAVQRATDMYNTFGDGTAVGKFLGIMKLVNGKPDHIEVHNDGPTSATPIPISLH